MFNRRTMAVLKRELKMKLFSKSFILMTVLIPVLMFGAIGIQALIATFESDADTKITVIAESDELTQKFQTEFSQLEFIKNNYYTLSYQTMPRGQFDEYIKNEKERLLKDQITGIVFVPQSALKDKKLEYYSKNPNNEQLFGKLKPVFNKVLVSVYFAEKQLSESEISFARENVDFSGFRISAKEQIEEEGFGGRILSFLFAFMLYFSLIFTGSYTMSSVVEEKSNRIVEVILSSVNATELMSGKIFGAVITGTVQMAIWLLPVILLISTTIFVLPPEFALNINMLQIIYFLFNIAVALITFIGLFTAVGAIFDNAQDAQQGMWPIMLLIMIPFFIAIGMQSNADNQIAKIGSMFPFASLILMPARMTLVDVPVWQFIVSIIVNVSVMLAVFPLAGKIYRVGILSTGKKPKLSEVIKWLKYS